MYALPWIVGASLVVGLVLTALWWRRWPSRLQCPACAAETALVAMRPGTRWMRRWFVQRWCSACGWEGFGRRGPAFDRKAGPSAHDSGFRWSRSESSAGPGGFTWGSTRPAPAAPEVNHPSGFRWAQTEADPAEAEPAAEESAAHPSGFRWAGSEEESTPEEAPGFKWGRPRPDPTRAPVFTWKQSG